MHAEAGPRTTWPPRRAPRPRPRRSSTPRPRARTPVRARRASRQVERVGAGEGVDPIGLEQGGLAKAGLGIDEEQARLLGAGVEDRADRAEVEVGPQRHGAAEGLDLAARLELRDLLVEHQHPVGDGVDARAAGIGAGGIVLGVGFVEGELLGRAGEQLGGPAPLVDGHLEAVDPVVGAEVSGVGPAVAARRLSARLSPAESVTGQVFTRFHMSWERRIAQMNSSGNNFRKFRRT